MKILGLILELNPFHNGHKYFIDKAINEIKPDLTIAIITSSFTMRGEISVLDKFEKTKLCLNNNIDIVLELPFIYAQNSSDYFAYYSIKILNEFKITHLAFGSEIGNIEDLENIYNITNSLEFNSLIQKELQKGSSYKTSALKALKELTNNIEILNNYSLPNNTLALSYLKAIKEINNKIVAYTFKRQDNQYYDQTIKEGKLASATALRKEINDNNDISPFIPNYQYEFVKESEAYQKLYDLYRYQLLNNPSFENIININEGIENRLYTFTNEKTYDDYVNNTQTKRYPQNRIKRIMLHILANSDKSLLSENNQTYLRVLGLNNTGLKHIKKLKNKNIIMNTKEALNNKNAILETELKMTRIYELITNKEIYKQEFILQVKKDDN